MITGKILEIACFSLESALLAQAAGADRIELCESYESGGITPSYQLIKEAREKIKIPLHVIIRPRGGDFIYSGAEIKQMEQDILFCKQQRINGLVFGVVTKNRQVDTALCAHLLALTEPLPVTFHRAIDECADLENGIRQLVDLDVHRVLTSGGKKNTSNNAERIKRLQATFGEQIIIMPGGGLRSSNILSLISTGCNEFHSSAITGMTLLPDIHEIKRLKQVLTGAL